jgi:two-component system response regulator PilR (NtrC family)
LKDERHQPGDWEFVDGFVLVPNGKKDLGRVDMSHLLIADDERTLLKVLQLAFKQEGHEVTTAGGVKEALRQLETRIFDLIVTDIKMNDGSGIDLLRAIRNGSPDTPVILMTAYATTETAIQALKMGASDYILKDHENFVDELKHTVHKSLELVRLRQENRILKLNFRKAHAIHNIIGTSPRMQELFRVIQTLGTTQSTVLIVGESGTGKELVARAIHNHSLRAEGPFISINCGAFPETLLESELFGHVKGAFTGAFQTKKGLFEAADRGTIFLDEIGEMSLSMQVKLLRFLQERTLRPVGGTDEIPVDVRVIAATNRDLQKMIAEGRFREDLYYRVSVIPLELPPLRERKEDIPVLAEHFLQKYNLQMQRSILRISPDALKCLVEYDWPGNVRELENTLERAVAFESTEEIRVERLPGRISCLQIAGSSPLSKIPENGFDLEKHLASIEKNFLVSALQQASGMQTKAAELLRMSFRSFRYLAKKYDLR